MAGVRLGVRIGLALFVLGLSCLPALLWFDNELSRQSDAALRNLALALPSTYKPSTSGDAMPLDGELRVQTWDAARRPQHAWPNETPGLDLQPPGFSTVSAGGRSWRVFSATRDDGFVQVAHPISGTLAARSTLPGVLLSSVVALLCGILIGWMRVANGGGPTVRAGTDASAHASLEAPGDARSVASERGLEARIERALTAQRDYLGDAAHELRSPLTALKLQIQIARRAETEEAREAAFQKVHDRLDRCTRLVNQLLTLSRHESHVARPEPVAVDLLESARAVVADHLAHAEARGIDLGIEGENVPLVVRGYPEGIRVMLGNLVDNALRYTPRGGKVDVVLARSGDAVSAAVADTGPGIPADSRARVFERFFRVSGTEAPGSGLGLAIVRSIADYHGATVALTDGEAHRGLTVRIDFPLP